MSRRLFLGTLSVAGLVGSLGCQPEVRIFSNATASSGGELGGGASTSSSSSSGASGNGGMGTGGNSGMGGTGGIAGNGGMGGTGGIAGNGGMGGMGGIAGNGGMGGMGGSGGAPPECVPGDTECVGETPRVCDASGHWMAGIPCSGATPICLGGSCVLEWSCTFGGPGAGTDCGVGASDCCGTAPVDGGTFNRSNDPAYPATVSAFKLDVHEVTIGRFRVFVDRGYGTQTKPPPPGAGTNPRVNGSGWNPAWNSNLATDTSALRNVLACSPGYPMWTSVASDNERMPMGCVTWYEAFAFCAWDGGRLPTEAEWNYAAAGGSEQRTLPWGSMISVDHATYDCLGDGSGPQDCSYLDILPVGQKMAGLGKYLHTDLAGSVWEFVLDTYATYPKPCDDCAVVDGVSGLSVTRGGAFNSGETLLSTAERNPVSPALRSPFIGFRCARD